MEHSYNFDTFYKTNYARCVRYIASRLNNKAVAEDITSDIMETILIKFSSIQNHNAYFFRAAKCVITNINNRVLHSQLYNDPNMISLETIYCKDKFVNTQDPMYILEEQQIETEYNNVICMLPPQERDIYITYRNNEHTRKDITDFYNISPRQLYRIVHSVNNKLSVAFPSFAEPVQIAC